MPPNQFWYCRVTVTILWISSLCSTMFIVNMTFERFYSIIRPLKAASFNTVKRAKITIICILVFSILYNIPHLYITAFGDRQCTPFGNAIETMIGQVYYWLSLVINFFIPFFLLLIMNSFIIHTIRNRSRLSVTMSKGQGHGQGHSEGQSTKIKSSEMQIYVILLLVTFGFLILMTPAYVLFVFVMFVDYKRTPLLFAQFIFLHSVSQKTYYTNYGINFFLYVISGQKFRTDLLNLFKFKRNVSSDGTVHTSGFSVSITRNISM